MKAWRLLLTRPAEENERLAAVLAEAGVHAVSLPMLAIDPLPETAAMRECILNLDHYRAVIVVSKNAARLGLVLLDRYWPQPPVLSWFTVGAATAAMLETYGLSVDYPTRGDDSEALLALPSFQNTIARPGGKVLIMRGENGREWLAEHLRQQGVSVDYLPLYRRLLPSYAEGMVARKVAEEQLNGLVVSSGDGFRHLLTSAGTDWPSLAELPLFAPSPRVAQLAREAGAKKIWDCRGASASSLLATLMAAEQL